MVITTPVARTWWSHEDARSCVTLRASSFPVTVEVIRQQAGVLSRALLSGLRDPEVLDEAPGPGRAADAGERSPAGSSAHGLVGAFQVSRPLIGIDAGQEQIGPGEVASGAQ